MIGIVTHHTTLSGKEITERNQEVTEDEMEAIRALGDFDLTMLISETHDHGWPSARVTLRLMPKWAELHPDTKEQDIRQAQEEAVSWFKKWGYR